MGFARPKTNSVTNIAMTNEINIEEYVDMLPRNWIPRGKHRPLRNRQNSEKLINHLNSEEETIKFPWE